MQDSRPDPDALLAKLAAEEVRALRGKLKIFFGASPGVGKTYAMLVAARQLLAQGVDVAVGVVETHGRSETAALLQGLEILPLKAIEYKNRVLKEFDLDAALARKPGLLLMDELAHSNAPGSRHPKRWQDVEELLAAGIDVLTTVNVQHLETLNDVVSGITGIKVWETLPDRLFDTADEVVLVDLPPDELLQRLKEGKVYLPQQAERAIQNFFRKGNLLALRELSLRRTADRVDEDVVAYRRDQSVAPVWPTQNSLLVCIGPEPGGEKLVRNGARLAAQFDVPWHVIYVETPELLRLPETRRTRLLKILKLAADLGAKTATLPGEDAALVALTYAREHNLGKIVLGRRSVGWRAYRFPWQRRFSTRLGAIAPDIDLILVELGGELGSNAREDAAVKTPFANPIGKAGGRTGWRQYGVALAVVVAVALFATPLRDMLELANIVMLFLLAVLFAAFKLGRGPGLLTAFLSVAAFDFFFVSPRLSFAVSDVQYLVTFAVMLTVALSIAHLTTGLSFQARVAESRERRMRALYEMARELSSALVLAQIEEIGDRFVSSTFGVHAHLLLPDDKGKLPVTIERGDVLDLGIAQWALDHGESAGCGTDTLPASHFLYVPLKATMRVRGVMAIAPRQEGGLLNPEQQRLLDTFAALIGIALERVHYITVAQEALVNMESERLRNGLLSSISHDLRTPLTALVGLIDAMMLIEPKLPPPHQEFAGAIREQAMRTNAQVNNLLDMARLQAGKVTLKREWQPLEDAVGAALQARATVLGGHSVRIDLPGDLPVLELDAVLMERAFCNLLENAAKYTPPGSVIEIAARVAGAEVEVSVCDNGPGLPPGREQAIFEKFTRGQEESNIVGVGLGLAIARAIVEAHGGHIKAYNRVDNQAPAGACFVLTLPIGNPPVIKETP
ncbi:MAG: two-component system sensor histidine kinase KdbD [Hydrogenophilales bacterium 28-61-23]|nr:MAG: two-component system sensor histidine kinase KdbD [Hydrogenophilales bacterium 28-61-23]